MYKFWNVVLGTYDCIQESKVQCNWSFWGQCSVEKTLFLSIYI